MNTATGRFVSMDSFEGNISDPLSLHKYVYANNNPSNRTDPSGNQSLGEQAVTIAINGVLSAIAFGSISYIFGGYHFARGRDKEYSSEKRQPVLFVTISVVH